MSFPFALRLLSVKNPRCENSIGHTGKPPKATVIAWRGEVPWRLCQSCLIAWRDDAGGHIRTKAIK